MQTRILSRIARRPLLRPLRPPSHHRPFAHNSQLLLIASHTLRPQILYLSQPPFSKPAGPSQQLYRLLSTENKRYFRDQVYIAGRWTLIAWTFIFLGAMIHLGILIDTEERRKPTPSEWRFFTRHDLRRARANLRVVEEGSAGFVDWAKVGSFFKNCLTRLETLSRDGKDLVIPVDGEGILIPDVGKAGFDISGKSYEWRTGYFEVIMGCAAAAEHLDGTVLDTTRGLVFPSQVVIGPSNPDPRPTPPYMAAAPREENCVAPFEKPEAFYMRILTGSGFTTEQRMDAALGYANWLEYKGLDDSATEMYRWALDMAKTALAVPADAVLEDKSAVIKAEGIREVTSNLLKATTNLAIHYARIGDLASALPILLSILRARREAPVSPALADQDSALYERGETDIGATVSLMRKVFRGPKFPDPSPSGDLPFVKPSSKPSCAESELMLYIGEILFATAPESKDGIAWTRQGVTIAEANIASGGRTESESDREGGRKCKECLLTGVANWETMLQRLSASTAAVTDREGGSSAGWMQFGGWFGGQDLKGKTLDELSVGVLASEMKQVERLKDRIAREGIDEELMRVRGGVSNGGLWVGG